MALLFLVLACDASPLATDTGPADCTDDARSDDADAYDAARDTWKAEHDDCVYTADCRVVSDATQCADLAVNGAHVEAAQGFLAGLLGTYPCAQPEEPLLCAGSVQSGYCRDCHCEAMSGSAVGDTAAHCPE
ncbi:MAG: hypothetical protein Q8P41_04880 [Pseudomonadota bacterium]|nr:hypothetical protein [Pseudomonadota bacterium]